MNQQEAGSSSDSKRLLGGTPREPGQRARGGIWPEKGQPRTEKEGDGVMNGDRKKLNH